MDRIYSNRIPGQRRIHIEINPTEIADVLADLGEDGPYDHPATDRFVDLLAAAHALFVEDEDDAQDAARTASGQQPETHPGYDIAGYPEPHAGPREKCPDPACETDQHANCGAECPAVGQPAEAQATDRAAVLREAAAKIEGHTWFSENTAYDNGRDGAIEWAVSWLRRMAEEARS